MEQISPTSINNRSSLMIAGSISAGFPSPADEVLQDIITFEEFLRPLPRTTMLFRIRDNAMALECIKENDIVVVETSRHARNGYIVLASVDGEWAIRRLRKKGRSFCLESGNENNQAIWAQDELLIGGVVTAMVRRY